MSNSFSCRDFVNEEEEEELLKSLVWDESGGNLKHRQVQHFGFDFVYGSNSIDPDAPNGRLFPAACDKIVSRAVDRGNLRVASDQCTVNRFGFVC